jgi:hypothetical protein
MRRLAIHLLALSGLAGTALAAPAALAARVEPGAQPVELVAPRNGATLAAGSTAELEWAPLASYARLAKIEEWEAFLSLDGGATYPLRVTPHLDQDLRHFRWQVPPIATADARLLLRLGDEHKELVVELPQRFSIVESPVAMAPAFLLEVPAPARGEPARTAQAKAEARDKDGDDDDDDGVVAWVEGSRRGGSLRQVVATGPSGFQTRIQPTETRDEAAEIAGGHSLPVRELRASLGAAPATPRGARLAGPLDIQPFAFDIRLLTQRQNE